MDSFYELKQNPNERRQELYEINSNTVEYSPAHWNSLLVISLLPTIVISLDSSISTINDQLTSRCEFGFVRYQIEYSISDIYGFTYMSDGV